MDRGAYELVVTLLLLAIGAAFVAVVLLVGLALLA